MTQQKCKNCSCSSLSWFESRHRKIVFSLRSCLQCPTSGLRFWAKTFRCSTPQNPSVLIEGLTVWSKTGTKHLTNDTPFCYLICFFCCTLLPWVALLNNFVFCPSMCPFIINIGVERRQNRLLAPRFLFIGTGRETDCKADLILVSICFIKKLTLCSGVSGLMSFNQGHKFTVGHWDIRERWLNYRGKKLVGVPLSQ